jgi:hypothetical protein
MQKFVDSYVSTIFVAQNCNFPAYFLVIYSSKQKQFYLKSTFNWLFKDIFEPPQIKISRGFLRETINATNF